MTDAADAMGMGPRDPARNRPALDERRLRRRYAAERRFKAYGVVAVGIAMAALAWLLFSIVAQGYQAFVHTHIKLDVFFDAQQLDPTGGGSPEALAGGNYGALYKKALRDRFGDARKRRDRRSLYKLLSQGAEDDLRDMVMSDPAIVGTRTEVWLTASDDVDMLIKGKIDRDRPERERPIKDKQLAWIDSLIADGKVETRFNTRFFSSGASREPELAGIWGAIMGSFFTMMVTLLLSFPVGVGAAVYLEEFAPKNRWTDLIEVNINNLAAVPSIVFGLLGLAVILNFFGVPRSAPLAGGMVLALMTLPTIIIATRAALKAVAALDPRGGARHRRVKTAGDRPPRAALGAPRHPDGYHHRHGPGAGRDGAAPDDRHGRLHRRHSDRPAEPGDGAPGADLSLERHAREELRREDQRRHHGAARFSRGHERDRDLSETEIRKALVGAAAGPPAGEGQWTNRQRRRPGPRARSTKTAFCPSGATFRRPRSRQRG